MHLTLVAVNKRNLTPGVWSSSMIEHCQHLQSLAKAYNHFCEWSIKIKIKKEPTVCRWWPTFAHEWGMHMTWAPPRDWGWCSWQLKGMMALISWIPQMVNVSSKVDPQNHGTTNWKYNEKRNKEKLEFDKPTGELAFFLRCFRLSWIEKGKGWGSLERNPPPHQRPVS